jgi:hypothetical protein
LEIIVKGGIPVWDKDEKKFVDKEMLKSNTSTESKLDDELTLGVENIKSNIQAATTVSEEKTEVVGTTSNDEDDDLPF